MRKFGSAGLPSVWVAAMVLGFMLTPVAFAQQVTFAPYLQLGDNGTFGPEDQIVVAWQTDETAPNPSAYKVEFSSSDDKDGKREVSSFQEFGRNSESDHRSVTPNARVVDNYLAVDPSLPVIPGAYGAHSNYTAVLRGLKYDTVYHYRVTGPGMPGGGFSSSFRSRKRGSSYSFVVVGDEGFFPIVPNSTPPRIVDYVARIAHLIYDAADIPLANQPPRPPAEFILNTGDNVYNEGTEDNYRDFFFPVYNSDQDSNESGAPILRSELFLPVDGNHDLGSTGVSANILADNAAPPFSGSLSGGDALVYFNDFYFPQNGPDGFDIQNAWNGDTSSSTGLILSYQGKTYNSPAAIQAFRNSTGVDTGKGLKLQIDHQSNYSFDYGNVHFLFLDANPHLFNDNLPSTNAFNAPPPVFTPYPSALRQWVIDDLDSSKQLWKIVVYHQPAFSSGDATIVNNQMRAVAKVLEDHGVNMVFNGHEHNYQRTLPIRSSSRAAGPVSTTAGSPAVNVDEHFDGTTDTVPDGVLYLVEGAGGNRDFDGAFAPPRGSGVGLDQDDSATGMFTDEPGLTVPQGPESWLDTNLTNREMANFLSNAGTAPKITSRFKAKVFSFGHVVVNDNKLTLFQISEPLQSTSSATPADPAPYGTDINGVPLNDPIPDTQVDPSTGLVVSVPATGTSALLDKWTVAKPELGSSVDAKLVAPDKVHVGQNFTYSVTISNKSQYALNGAQVRLELPEEVTFAGTLGDTVTLQVDEVVVTVGRVAVGGEQTIEIPVQVSPNARRNEHVFTSGEISSSTALPVMTNKAATSIEP
jgi:uncharacterized repeat protein (TIGR01451 family)